MMIQYTHNVKIHEKDVDRHEEEEEEEEQMLIFNTLKY